MGKIVYNEISMGIFFKWTLYVHWTYPVHFLCPNDIRPEQSDAKSYSEQLFFRKFCPEMRSFARKLKKLRRNFSELHRAKKMFIFSFLSFPAKERISGQKSLKKSCLEYDFASDCSGWMSFGHKKWFELSPMDI